MRRNKKKKKEVEKGRLPKLPDWVYLDQIEKAKGGDGHWLPGPVFAGDGLQRVPWKRRLQDMESPVGGGWDEGWRRSVGLREKRLRVGDGDVDGRLGKATTTLGKGWRQTIGWG